MVDVMLRRVIETSAAEDSSPGRSDIEDEHCAAETSCRSSNETWSVLQVARATGGAALLRRVIPTPETKD